MIRERNYCFRSGEGGQSARETYIKADFSLTQFALTESI